VVLCAIFKTALSVASFIKEGVTEKVWKVHNFLTPVKTNSGIYSLLTILLLYSPKAKEQCKTEVLHGVFKIPTLAMALLFN